MTYSLIDRFDLGLDLRKGSTVSDANRLRVALNCSPTSGYAMQARPGLTHVGVLNGDTTGLYGFRDTLYTFSNQDVTHEAGVDGLPILNRQVPHPDNAERRVTRVHMTDVFNNRLYVVVGYEDGSTRHHYINGAAPWVIVDTNCPHHPSAAIINRKVYSPTVDEKGVQYCATGQPIDWTSANDAGFLSTGLYAPNQPHVEAVGEYDKRLVVFMPASSQIWFTDTNPVNITLEHTVPNVGTIYPSSIHKVGRELFFLSPVGFRSIGQSLNTENLKDFDIGTPIDSRVREMIGEGVEVDAQYYPAGGQYWCRMNDMVWVYTYSRSDKIQAWSEYRFAVSFDASTTLGTDMYIRSGNDVYLVDENALHDGDEPVNGDMTLGYQQFKRPGRRKMFDYVDLTLEGSAYLNHLFDPNRPERMTKPIRITDDQGGYRKLGVGVNAVNIAPRLTWSSDMSDKRMTVHSIGYNWRGMK